MSKIRIAWVISNIDRWQPFEWVSEAFINSDIQIDYYLLAPKKGYFFDYLKGIGLHVEWLPFHSKLHYPTLIFKLWRRFIKNEYSVVHCHFLDANICGLIAASLSFVPKKIYTRHHSTFHHQFAPKGVLMDKLCNRLSTKIVAISQNVRNVLVQRENVPPKKVVIINHGFDFIKILNIDSMRVESIAIKYDLKNRLVIGVVSRFIEWKGVQYVIKAFKDYQKINKEAVLVLTNARGNYTPVLMELLSEIPVDNYRIIPFEQDIYALFKNFDIFIHTPIDEHIEAFGQIYIESMALGIPGIFTISGIGTEILEDLFNALTVPYKSYVHILEAMITLTKDHQLALTISDNATKTVKSRFTIEKMHKELEFLYTGNK